MAAIVYAEIATRWREIGLCRPAHWRLGDRQSNLDDPGTRIGRFTSPFTIDVLPRIASIVDIGRLRPRYVAVVPSSEIIEPLEEITPDLLVVTTLGLLAGPDNLLESREAQIRRAEQTGQNSRSGAGRRLAGGVGSVLELR